MFFGHMLYRLQINNDILLIWRSYLSHIMVLQFAFITGVYLVGPSVMLLHNIQPVCQSVDYSSSI